jgi:hypothetical protein
MRTNNIFTRNIEAILKAEGDPERAAMIRKADVGGSASSDFDSTVSTDFYLANEHNPAGLFQWALNEGNPGAVGVAPYLATGVVANYISGGLGIPVSKLTAAGDALARQKVAGIVIVMIEAAKHPANLRIVEKALRQSIRLAEDQRILALAAAGTTNIFPTTGTILGDKRLLLDAVNLTAYGSLAFVMHPSKMNIVATAVADGSNLPIFPDADPARGGSVLGIRVIPSEAAGDNLYLLDANSLVTCDDGLSLRTSDSASVEMADVTDQDAITPTGSTNIISCFQANALALLGIKSFCFQLMRPSGCAVIENVDWDEVTTSTGA